MCQFVFLAVKLLAIFYVVILMAGNSGKSVAKRKEGFVKLGFDPTTFDFQSRYFNKSVIWMLVFHLICFHSFCHGRVSEICCLTSHASIFQLYVWRCHIVDHPPIADPPEWSTTLSLGLLVFNVTCNDISVIYVTAPMCRRTEEVVPTVGLPTP